MLYVYTGTDRAKAREAMWKAVHISAGKQGVIERIGEGATVANDVLRTLSSKGLFGGDKTIVIDGVFENEEAREALLNNIEPIAASPDTFYVFEEKIDAASLRLMKKHLAGYEKFDAPKKEENNVFALANALKRGEKKALWLSYVEQIGRGNAPEALHGILFWAAKSMLLAARAGTEPELRAKKLVAGLAQLPHESRRRGIELEYALEHFILRCV